MSRNGPIRIFQICRKCPHGAAAETLRRGPPVGGQRQPNEIEYGVANDNEICPTLTRLYDLHVGEERIMEADGGG